ncbi:hypothetical protein AMELA_G00107090 [Ameiurus melas]|uniref:Claudin n=1 Tax=Ameiurus melas TaxID=219545 RepID=A0A7J6AUJ3_AMEME|nr:hypothetical protein AMELA_G00107090 [Ameiurus melas]
MATACLQLSGFFLSVLGWICVIIATSTSDWVIRCKYGMNTCRKMDELETKGLWEQCVISTALYHCYSLNQILELPAMFSLVSTVWFPVGAHQELGLMSFGFSLYSGWVGGALSLLGGCILTCCSIGSTPSYHQNNRYSYYSKQNPPTNQTPPTSNHAKTAQV